MFVYDMVGVFGTKTIQTVASGLPVDLPIKLVCPKLLEGDSGGSVIVGLGDVVIPGLACAFARRYDLTEKYSALTSTKLDYSRGPFYKSAIVAYLVGLGATFIIFKVTGHA